MFSFAASGSSSLLSVLLKSRLTCHLPREFFTESILTADMAPSLGPSPASFLSCHVAQPDTVYQFLCSFLFSPTTPAEAMGVDCLLVLLFYPKYLEEYLAQGRHSDSILNKSKPQLPLAKAKPTAPAVGLKCRTTEVCQDHAYTCISAAVSKDMTYC